MNISLPQNSKFIFFGSNLTYKNRKKNLISEMNFFYLMLLLVFIFVFYIFEAGIYGKFYE